MFYFCFINDDDCPKNIVFNIKKQTETNNSYNNN